MTDHSVLLGRISTDMPSQPEINPEATASFASIEHLKQMIRTGVLDLERFSRKLNRFFKNLSILKAVENVHLAEREQNACANCSKKLWRAMVQTRNWIS